MVLKLRLAPKFWREVSAVRGDFDQVIQRLMVDHECLLFEARVVEDCGVNCVRRVLASGGFEFLLQKPLLSEALGFWDYDVIAMRRESEKREVVGVQVTDQVLVYTPANVCDGAVAVVVKVAVYRRLPDYDKAAINLAWRRIAVGRTLHRVVWQNDVMFYMPRKVGERESVIAEAVGDMGEALERVGAGRVLTDVYELRRVREMASKYGESVAGCLG